jgi:hypothetical protein
LSAFKVDFIAVLLMTAALGACGEGRADAPPTKPAAFQAVDAYPEGGARPWTSLNFLDKPEDFHFAIVGDRAGDVRPGVFEGVLRKVNLLRPEFVMTIGDFVEGYTKDNAALDAQWAAFLEEVKPLEAPLFFVVGNHDINDENTAALWRKRFGLPHYAFVYKNVLFIALDTEDSRFPTPRERVELDKALAVMKQDPAAVGAYMKSNPVIVKYLADTDAGRIGDAQIQWVLDVLDKHRSVRWTLFFMHRPVWKENIPNVARIEAALAGRGYTMFAGHTHHQQWEVRGGRDYVQVGTAGGGWSPKGQPGEMDMVTWVTMRDGGPVFTHLMASGILAKDQVAGAAPGAEFCGPSYGLDCRYADRAK